MNSTPTMIVILDQPFDGSGSPPHGFYHFWKVFDYDRQDMVPVAYISMTLDRDFAIDFANQLAEVYGITHIRAEWINQ